MPYLDNPTNADTMVSGVVTAGNSVKQDLTALNSQIANLHNTIYTSTVITNTVPSQQATVVRQITVPPGKYLFIGMVLYSDSFSNFAASSIIFGSTAIVTVRGTGANGGEGTPLICVAEFNANATINLSALQYSAGDKPINTNHTHFHAIKLI